ncbi:hypothetical protein WG906_09750 [Pedobacter sp. P351]|uniref:hypothetical protein n=1 Tax=Pedobacter superstes TaxID=3133441 RepID=UPI0030B2C03F
MSITLERYELLNLIEDCMEVAIKRYRVEIGEIPAMITLAEAYRRYTQRKVDMWIKLELIIPIKRGSSRNSKVEVDYMKCEILNKETQHSYLTILNKSKG